MRHLRAQTVAFACILTVRKLGSEPFLKVSLVSTTMFFRNSPRSIYLWSLSWPTPVSSLASKNVWII
jgi:hypothetical protein